MFWDLQAALGDWNFIEQEGNEQEVELAEAGPSRVLNAKRYKVGHYFICWMRKLKH